MAVVPSTSRTKRPQPAKPVEAQVVATVSANQLRALRREFLLAQGAAQAADAASTYAKQAWTAYQAHFRAMLEVLDLDVTKGWGIDIETGEIKEAPTSPEGPEGKPV